MSYYFLPNKFQSTKVIRYMELKYYYFISCNSVPIELVEITIRTYLNLMFVKPENLLFHWSTTWNLRKNSLKSNQ